MFRAALTGLDPRVPWVSGAFFLFIAARLSVLTFVTIFYVREVGLDTAAVGLAFLLENVMRALAAPIAGTLSDRVGRVPLLVTSALAAAVVMPAFLLVRDVPTLLVWSACIGLAQAPFFAVATALLLDLVPPERRQRALALNYSALSVGYTVGVAPAGFLAERSFTALGLASSALFMLVAAIALVRLRGAPRDAAVHAEAGFAARTVQAFRDGPFLLLASLAFALPLSLGLVSLAVPLFAAEAGAQPSGIGLALAASGLLSLLAVPANSALERYGPFRSLPPAALLVAVSYVALVLGAPSLVGFLVAIGIFTLGEIVFAAALPAAVASLAPAGARGAYQGAWSMVIALGIGSALFVAGLGRSTIGWPATWLGFAAVTTVAAVGLALAGRRLTAVAVARAA